MRLDVGERACAAPATGWRSPAMCDVGGKDVFDQAIADFSAAYGDKNERDFAPAEEAVSVGRIPIQRGL